MVNHMEESGGVVWSDGGYPYFLEFQFQLSPPPPVYNTNIYTDPNFFDNFNIDCILDDWFPIQDPRSYGYWRQTYDYMHYAMHNQNQNQHQINNTYFNVPSDGVTDYHNINDDEDRQFPSYFEDLYMNREWRMDASAADEGAVVILESYPNDVRYQEARGSGLSENTISNYLKTRKCTHQDPQSSNICVVCQYDICLNEELIATLDCGHEFHIDCIKQWLKQKNVCPLCKSEALPLASVCSNR